VRRTPPKGTFFYSHAYSYSGLMDMSEDIESIRGVGSNIAAKLREAGYTTIESIIVAPPREIMYKTGIGYNVILKIQEAGRSMLSIDFETAAEVYERKKTLKKCTMGSKKLDEILGGRN